MLGFLNKQLFLSPYYIYNAPSFEYHTARPTPLSLTRTQQIPNFCQKHTGGCIKNAGLRYCCFSLQLSHRLIFVCGWVNRPMKGPQLFDLYRTQIWFLFFLERERESLRVVPVL